MEHTLIIARMDPRHRDDVARVFAESDAGPLPATLGVTRRMLFSFHGLYCHLIESDPGLEERVAAAARTDPAFTDVSRKLQPYMSAYDPETWRVPSDAMATQFYSWRPALTADGRR